MQKTRATRVFIANDQSGLAGTLELLEYAVIRYDGASRDSRDSLLSVCDFAILTKDDTENRSAAQRLGIPVFDTIDAPQLISNRQFVATGDPRFHALLKEIGELHSRKSHDYGSNKDSLANLRSSESYGVPAWVGAAIREHDKTLRVQSFLEKGCLLNESIEDAWLDKATYSLIALILYREYRDAQEKSTGDAPGPQ